MHDGGGALSPIEGWEGNEGNVCTSPTLLHVGTQAIFGQVGNVVTPSPTGSVPAFTEDFCSCLLMEPTLSLLSAHLYLAQPSRAVDNCIQDL